MDRPTADTTGEGDETPQERRHRITRDRLRDGSHLAELRANPPPGYVFRTDAEIDACLRSTLADRPAGGDIWVFGYGSLMWNPAIHYAERKLATVHGWHRRFCLWMRAGRGTPERPGLMLALDRGGSCRGVAFRLPPEDAEHELLLLWRREMLSGAYQARWVDAQAADGPVRAIVFVANRRHARFAGVLPDAEVARHVAMATGTLGSCADYLRETVEHLRELGLRDRSLERIRAHMPQR
jgi:cation transport protein ChaC